MSREIPIIFNGDMVRAILAGQKTQTRRPVRSQAIRESLPVEQRPKWICGDTGRVIPCPFGQPGDLLWVRETWSQIDDTEFGGERWIDYRATPKYPESSVRRPAGWDDEPESTPLRWRPSIHMPRWASRILLRVTASRVERLRDITEADAVAEGFSSKAEFIDAVLSIYGLPDDANPWVWVIEFERVTDSKREAA